MRIDRSHTPWIVFVAITALAAAFLFMADFFPHRLPFPILSDEDHKIVDAYGVWVEKSMYGRTYMGTERTTFIIGPDGKIKAILSKVKPDEHLDQVMELI